MSRIFNALRQSEIDQEKETEASFAARPAAQQPEKVSERSPSAWTTVEVEEIPASAPPLAESVAIDSVELPEVVPVATVAVEELPTLPEPAPVEWAATEASKEIPTPGQRIAGGSGTASGTTGTHCIGCIG